MRGTRLIYQERPYEFETKARVMEIQVLSDGDYAVLLDQTNCMLAGGGQRGDAGFATLNGLPITALRQTAEADAAGERAFKDFPVWHVVSGEHKLDLAAGAEVTLQVNEPHRRLDATQKTLAHIVAAVMLQRGIHYTKCKLSDDEMLLYFAAVTAEQFMQALNAKKPKERDPYLASVAAEVQSAVNKAVEDGLPVVTGVDDAGSRVIHIGERAAGLFSYKCGGVHATNTRELPQLAGVKLNVKAKYDERDVPYTLPDETDKGDLSLVKVTLTARR